MNSAIRFETPENVQVAYEPAGLGTRFLAWFLDQLLLWVVMFVAFLGLLAAGVSFGALFDESKDPDDSRRALLYFMGMMMLLWGLGSFVYFALCELLLRGQTVGKRVSNIRVVKTGGFQLDAASILVRNVFRVADHLPPLWIIPAMSRLGQRAGDMVAGTIVVADAPAQLSGVRTSLAARTVPVGIRTPTLRPWRSPSRTRAPCRAGPRRKGAALLASMWSVGRSTISSPSGAMALPARS